MNESDLIIEEIRESRRRMSAECNHDPKKFVANLKKLNQKYSKQVDRFRKKDMERRTPAETLK